MSASTERVTATPLTVGRVTLRNRLTTAPMERNYCDTEGHFSEQYLDYLMERVRAGVALVTIEATYVRADGKGRTHQLGLHDDTCIAPLRPFTDAAHAEGVLVGVELNHGGRTAQTAVTGLPTVAPSPVPCPAAGGQVPRELTTAECYELARCYGAAAARAVAAGVDVLSIHGGHGYLVHQFMSPISNHRTDEFAAPERFLDLVVDEVRAAAPDVTLGVRVSVVEGPAEGIDAETQVGILERLDLRRLDFLDLSAGSYDAGEWIVQSGEWQPGVLAPYAAAYRRFGLPLGMAGRLNSPEIVEQVLVDGVCDFVSLARGLHADPTFATACLTGTEPYRPCIACNVCIDRLGAGQVTCSVNPTVGRSRIPVATPTVRPGTRVSVVGAGPAGITAARELALAGADVTLSDRAEQIGGAMAAAATMDSTPDFRRYLSWANHELGRLGVRISLRDSGTPSDVDAILLATGNPPVPSERAPATDVQSWLAAGGLDDVTNGRVDQVTILGADAVAMSLADTLATRGARVRVIGPQSEMAPESGRRAKILAVPRLAANTAVDIRLGAMVVDAAEGSLLVQDASGTSEWVDAPGPVLASLGVLPCAAGPAGVAPQVTCVEIAVVVTEPGPTTISAAVREGYDVSQRLAGRLAAETGVDHHVGVR